MRFASGPVSSMSLVEMGFIFDMQTLRRESRQQLRRDDILHSHCSAPKDDAGPGAATIKRYDYYCDVLIWPLSSLAPQRAAPA